MRAIGTALAFALCLLLLAPPDAGGMRWRGKRVPVYAHVPADWQPRISGDLAAFNAATPKGAPRFVHRIEAEADCSEVGHTRGVVVCLSETLVDPNALAETTWERQRGSREVRRAWVRVRPAAVAELDRVLCHELAHAILGIGDNWTFDGTQIVYPEPDTSCVWGNLGDPGPFDTAYAKRVYRRHR